MKILTINAWKNRGSSLIETVIAMGVLAVAIPLVFGALAESGKSTLAAEADTHSTWIIPACMAEIQASRNGSPQFFSNTVTNETFPPQGEVWVLAFSKEGLPIGKITQSDYAIGIKQIDRKPIRYLAKLSAEHPPSTEMNLGQTPILRVLISLEFPATSPAAKRQKREFYTRIP